MAKTLLLQGIKCQKQMWPCFCRGSTLTNLNDCDFASAGSRKIKNGQDLASAGDQVPRTNATLLLQGVYISTNLNNCDFASAGSQKIKNGQDLASVGDHRTTFLKFNLWFFLNECMFECMRIYDLPLLWMDLWMHEVFF